jgi:hypothetical protein
MAVGCVMLRHNSEGAESRATEIPFEEWRSRLISGNDEPGRSRMLESTWSWLTEPLRW